MGKRAGKRGGGRKRVVGEGVGKLIILTKNLNLKI